MVAVVGGLGLAVVLASGASSSALPAARTSARKRSPAPPKAKPSSDPRGEVTFGPPTVIKTSPSGAVTRVTDTRGMTPSDIAAYELAEREADRRSPLSSPLLTDEQQAAIEDESVQRARSALPGASAMQQELAKRAAQRARETLGAPPRRGVPKIPANPNIDVPPIPLKLRDDAPKAFISAPTPINFEKARREAPGLAKHIRLKEFNYSRQALKAFQSHAGITIDGIYGPLSVSALKHFGVRSPPKALFKAAPGSLTIFKPA